VSRARWTSLEEAAASVPDGASVVPGGFMLGRAPMALVFALVRAGRKNLHVLSLPNPLPSELLVAAGAAARVDFLFTAITLDGRVRAMPCLKRAVEAGTIAWGEHDGYRLVQRFRAASMGLPFLPVPDFNCSALAERDPLPEVTDPFTGESVHVERAFHPDVAEGIIADQYFTGGMILHGWPLSIQSAALSSNGGTVDLLVEEPCGAWPSGCAGLYPADEAHLVRYLDLAEESREAEYLDATVRVPRRQAELARAATPTTDSLRSRA